MAKRFLSILVVLTLILTSMIAVPLIKAENVVESTADFDLTKSTATAIFFTGNDGIELGSTLKSMEISGADSGIYIDGQKANLNLRQSAAKNGVWKVAVSGITDGTVFTIKGTFKKSGYDSVHFAAKSVKYNASTKKWEKCENPTEEAAPDAVLTVDYQPTFKTYSNEAKGIYFTSTDKLDSVLDTKIVPKSGDDNGVFINGVKNEQIFFTKPANGKRYLDVSAGAFEAKADDVLLIQGEFTCGGNAYRYKPLSFKFDGANWVLEDFADMEADCTIELDKASAADVGGKNGIYLKADDSLDVLGWETPVYSVCGKEDGVFYNGTQRTDVYLKKTNGNCWYVCLSDCGITAAEDDQVTVKGRYIINGKMCSFAENTFTFDGTKWTQKEAEPVYTDVRLVDLDGASGYSESGERWDLYFSADTVLPGLDDTNANRATYDITVKIDGTAHTVTAYKASYKNDGKMLYFSVPNTLIAKDVDPQVTLTVPSGEYLGSDVLKSIRVTEDKTVYFKKGNVDASSFEIDIKEKDIVLTLDPVQDNTAACFNLITADSAPALGWEKLINGIDDESGVFLNGEKTTVSLKKPSPSSYHVNLSDRGIVPQENDVITIKGTFKIGEYGYAYKSYSLTFDGEKWVDNTEPTVVQSNIALKLNGNIISDKKGIYLTTSGNEPTLGWEAAVSAFGKDSGVFHNGTKTDAIIKKYDKGQIYLDLAGAGISVKENDTVSLKGTFKYLEDGYSYKEYKLTYKNGAWVDGTEKPTQYTEITVKSLDGNASGYKADRDQYHLYFLTDKKMPGGPDQLFFPVDVTIDNKTKKTKNTSTLECWHAAYKDTFFIIIDCKGLGVTYGDELVITTTGTPKTADSKYGLKVKQFTCYINKYGISLNGFAKPITVKDKNAVLSLDNETAGWTCGNDSGIYLKTTDGFPVDSSWNTVISAVAYDQNAGIYYNGTKLSNAVLKKFADGKMYLDLLAGGVAAKDKDKVTVKGVFALGSYGVSYSAVTFYYNGQSWNTKYTKPMQKQVTSFTAQSVDPVSGYNDGRDGWDIYLHVDKMLPGGVDTMSFYDAVYTVKGKQYKTFCSHSYQDCLYFFVPGSIVPKNAADGMSITLNPYTAMANDNIYGVKNVKDFTIYTFRKTLSTLKPSSNPNYQKIEPRQLIRSCFFNEDAKGWQLFAGLDKEINAENATKFLDVPVYINGKLNPDVELIKDSIYLYIFIPETVVPKDAKRASLSIKAGAKGIFNAGHGGILFTKDFNAYLFGNAWSFADYDHPETIEYRAKDIYYQAYNKDIKRYDIYLSTSKAIPGTDWFEDYKDFCYYYNGKKITTSLMKPGSSTGKACYFGVVESDIGGKVKEGDVVTVKAGTTCHCGPFTLVQTNDYSLKYLAGKWVEWMDSKVEAPKPFENIWSVAGFEDNYIPVQTDKGVLYTSGDKYNRIISKQQYKDFSIEFTSEKWSTDPGLPNNTIILRGNPIDEEEPMNVNILYGYVVTFSLQELNAENCDDESLYGTQAQIINVWKNGIHEFFQDQYLLASYLDKTNNPYFNYGIPYKYRINVFNLTENRCCIQVFVNDKLAIQVIDEAAEDEKDPAKNAGDFCIYAACATYLNAPFVESEKTLVSETECKVGQQVRVSATYPFVLENASFEVDKNDGATVKDGVFKATKPGTYTVWASYKGKKLAPATIKVVKDVTSAKTSEKSAFPIVPVAIGAGVALLAAAGVIILLVKKKKSKA